VHRVGSLYKHIQVDITMNTAHNVGVLTKQKGLQRHKTQEKHGCTCRKTQWCLSDQMSVVSIRWIHTCIRKSFLTIWCSCRNSKHTTYTNTHTMNQSAKKFTSACTQAYLEKMRKKHDVNSSRNQAIYFTSLVAPSPLCDAIRVVYEFSPIF
jgi:hypothetical protein